MKTTKIFICGYLIDLSLITNIKLNKSYEESIEDIESDTSWIAPAFITINFLSGKPIEIRSKDWHVEEEGIVDSDFQRIYDELVKAWSGVEKSSIPSIDYKS